MLQTVPLMMRLDVPNEDRAFERGINRLLKLLPPHQGLLAVFLERLGLPRTQLEFDTVNNHHTGRLMRRIEWRVLLKAVKSNNGGKRAH